MNDFLEKLVTAVKYDQIDKLAMDSEMINKFSQKNKYQMPNLNIY